MEAFVIGILVTALAGFIIGTYVGVKWGNSRTNTLLYLLVDTMEELRSDSKIKAWNKTKASKEGRSEDANKLDTELIAESKLFLRIQHQISSWCINRDQKDPFAL